jgi:hypothetical protein
VAAAGILDLKDGNPAVKFGGRPAQCKPDAVVRTSSFCAEPVAQSHFVSTHGAGRTSSAWSNWCARLARTEHKGRVKGRMGAVDETAPADRTRSFTGRRAVLRAPGA